MDLSNPWSQQHRTNPQALWNAMRAEHPVYRLSGPNTGSGVWFITGYEAATVLLKHSSIIKDMKNLPTATRSLYGGDDSGTPFDMMSRNMLFMDPPDHTRLRNLVHKAFTPRQIQDLRVRVVDIAQDALSSISSDEFDLIQDFALPVPITVIAEILGVPAEDRIKFRTWVDRMLFGRSMEEAGGAAMEFMMYFHEHFDRRKAEPQDDLTSALLAVEEQGDHLSREELMGMVFLLLTAGHETTVNLIGNGMLALMQNPAEYKKLQQNPDLITSAVEEFLRYDGPVDVTTQRWAGDDIEIEGKTIKTGEFIGVSLIGANHDPTVFDDPQRLDITRTPNRHIAFGAGIHYCIGAPLARLEGQIAFHELMTHFEKLELTVNVDALEWNNSTLLHGLRHLPVRAIG